MLVHGLVPQVVKMIDVRNLGYGIRTYYKGVTPGDWIPNHRGFYKATKLKCAAYCFMPPNMLPNTQPGSIQWGKVSCFDAESMPVTRNTLNAMASSRKRLNCLKLSRKRTKGSKSSNAKKSRKLTRSSNRKIVSSNIGSPPTVVTSFNEEQDCQNCMDDEEEDCNEDVDYSSWVYWTSSEAEKDFGLERSDVYEDIDHEDIRSVVKKRIEKLKTEYQEVGGWRNVISDRDTQNLYSG